ncbi:MAG TPA: hypothetical protein VGB30_07550 [bacterium]|jgi:hypothetical protein
MSDEQTIYNLELTGALSEDLEELMVRGTAGEVLEQVADAWGLEDDPDGIDASIEGIYPSVKAYLAHQLIEDHMGKSGAFSDPESLIKAMILDGTARILSDDELDEILDDEEMDEYEEERASLDEEWTDGVWET